MNEEGPDQACEVIATTGRGIASKCFLPSAAMILAITGIAKVWAAFGSVRLLTVADPVIGIQFKQLLLAVGVAELIIAAVALSTKFHRLALMLVAWLATNFLAYRIGLWWMDWHKPCNCLGNITDALHIPPQVADNIMKVVLAYLLIGSYGLLISEWRKARGLRPSEQLPVADR